MSYVLWVKGRAYYSRRVPELIREFDCREYIRIALKTDSKEMARKRATMFNEQVEEYWQELVHNQEQHENSRFRKIVRMARHMGFSYKPMSQVVNLPILELLERVFALKDATPKQVDAVLGGREELEVTIQQALDMFWGLAKDKILTKSEFQIRKWKNPRRKAVEYFIALKGNKYLKEVTRDDIIALRDWWLDRIKEEGISASTANKSMMHLKSVFETVATHLKLELDIDHLFKKIFLKAKPKKTRLPFTPEQIRAILSSPKLDNMHPEGKWFLYAIAETGARPCELVGLPKQHIVLDDAIPYIDIKEPEGGELKTEYSPRKIPLVGHALEAFKNLPDGFVRYRNKSDHLTTAVNKFLRENGLVPAKGYTCYSFRHSFQDRLLKAKAPDRVQTDLMGHKFDRPDYGLGADMETKLEYMNMICLKSKHDI